MRNKAWLDILKKKRKLDPDCEVTPLGDGNLFYLVEGVDLETSTDELLLVYDISASLTERFDYEGFDKTAKENNDPYPVLVFKNWEHEREIYWTYYDNLGSAFERKKFTDWFDKKISIYVDSGDDVILKVDDSGINYLKYEGLALTPSEKLHGQVYNLSFFELKKLYNVTGADLFINNVRYGLQKNRADNTLRSRFREYLGVAAYRYATDLGWNEEKLGELQSILDIDQILFQYLDNDPSDGAVPQDGNNILFPENFWFYHNGISIFSWEETLRTPANQIVLSPGKVSVINGAQTLTNFFLEVDSITRNLKQIMDSASIPINEILKKIYVKTIVINGDPSFIRPITHGLNTQIPILEETLLSDSELSDDINDILARDPETKGKIKILKDGEPWAGETGLGTLDFAKHWLTVQGRPGRSKNFRKSELKKTLEEIANELKKERNDAKKIRTLLQIYQWWDSTKSHRLDDCDEETAVIGKYGKNYFGSYVLLNEPKEMDDPALAFLYERFVKEMKSAAYDEGIDISMNAFKNDALFDAWRENETTPIGQYTPEISVPPTMEEDIAGRLNQKGQSAYAFSRTIADYLLENDIKIDYFRVISRTGKHCKEAFPFPNSTFNEIIDSLRYNAEAEKPEYRAYSDSKFAEAIKKIFPVFILDKDDEDRRNLVTKVHFIPDFSFGDFEEDAKEVYIRTVNAFLHGDEQEFPRSSEGISFHIRPKAIDAEDTFQFTNGKYITKRTFWANKATVESIIEQKVSADTGRS